MKRFLLPVISIFFLVATIFSACEVGLGESVDTEKPTVSIEYPPKNVVIKEDFVISGKCHDETSLKSVTLQFQNSETKNEHNFTATLSDDKNSWSAKINEFDSDSKKYPLPDGTYFVTAIATDGSGKTQEDKSTLRIDNTPPLLVLTNPSTVLDEKTPLEKAGGFGATIKLQGSVNDFSVTDNDSGSELVFTVFDGNNNYLGRREMSNIPPSLGIIIGEYSSSTENLTDSNKFYNTIYGTAGEVVDTKYRKFKITVSDSARTYKGENVAANADERGNITECYYLKDEIYTDVIYNFSIGYSEIYEIIKKQVGKTAELSDREKTVLDTLAQFKHESDDEYEDNSEDSLRTAATSRVLKIAPVGTFSLNPKNNPSYEITSIDAFDSTSEKPWEEKSISTSGNITLLAKCGLSEAPLDSETFKVILFKTDEKGVRLTETDEDKNEDVEIPCEWTKNGSNYTGRVTLSTKYVQVAQFYGIELKGNDTTGLEFYNGSKIYRFLVQTGTTPPDVKITGYSAPSSGSTVYLKKKENSTEVVDLVISGTAESRSGSAKGKVTLWPVINGNKEQYSNVDEYGYTTKSNTENSWTLTIPGKLFNDEKSDSYTVTIYARDEISNETSKEVFVICDKENPKISINSVNNVVVFDSDTTIKVGANSLEAKANRGYVNEKITLSGNVSDNDAFASGSWKATCDEKEIATGTLDSSQIKIEIDTILGTDGKNLEINFTALDRAGNKANYEYKYEDGNSLIISQLTDYPRVSLSNADLSVTTEEGIQVGKNLFDQTGNNRISGSIVDDDGIDTVEIYYSEIGNNEFKLLYNGKLNANGKTSYSFNQELKDSNGNALAEGFYRIKIVAKDKKADSESANVKTTETEPFVVCINNGAPTITFTNPIKYSDAYQSAAGFTVTGKVTGEFRNDKPIHRGTVDISVKEDGTWSDDVLKDSEGKFSNGIEQDESTGVYTITYSVKDRFNRETIDTVTFKIDEEEPKPEITQVSPLVTDSELSVVDKNYKKGAVNGTITVQGSASDNDKVISTVLKICKAKIENNNIVGDGDAIQSLSYDGTSGKTGEAISIPEGITNTVNNFKFAVNTEKLADNQGIILRIECKDSSGNTGVAEYPVYVCQDTDIPTLKFNNGDVNCTDETEIKVGNNLFGMGSNTLYINVTDDDGVKYVAYTVDDDKEQKTLLSDGSSTTFSAGIDVSTLGEGVHSLKFEVKDVDVDVDVNKKSQNFPKEDGSTIKVAYDNDVPEISVLKLGNVTYTPGCFAKQTFQISGTVKDSSGIVTISEKSQDGTESIKIENCSSVKEWTTSDITNNSGDITKTFVAKDKYGREKTLEIKYKVDTEAPKFVSDYIYLTGETVNGSKTYRLGGSDDKYDTYNSENTWFTGSSFTIKGGDGTSSNIPVTETNDFEIKLYKGSKTSENLISTIQPSGSNKNFSGNIDVGMETDSTIILVAIDEAGNESNELLISVNVDKDAPALETKEIYLENPNENSSAQPLAEKGFVNKDKVYVKFEATDSVSKVKTVEIYKTAAMKEKLGEKVFETPVETASDVIEVDVSGFDSKEYDLYIKVTDVAGNAITSDLPNFIFDKNPPVVTYSSPMANSDANKLIAIEGSIDDLNPPETNSGWNLQLKVKKPNSTSFEVVSSYAFDTTVETSKFKVSGIDTEQIGEGNAEFIVIATDKAGNTINESTGKSLILNINQDSDRPIIQLNTISTQGTTTLSSSTISGTISDDDGIKSLEIQLVKKSDSGYASITESGWKKATLNGSNWTCSYFDSSNDIDGDYKIYFKVTDSENGVFETPETEPSADTEKWKCPKINFEGKNEVCNAVKFSIDSTPPVIKFFEFATSKDNSNWSEWKEVNNNQLFGGINYRYVKFRVLAYDTVSEQDDLSVSIKIPEINRTYLYAGQTKSASEIKLSNVSATVDGKTYYYFETSGSIDFNDSNNLVPTGSYTIEVEAKDKAEKPKTMSLGIIVDNTAPNTISKLNHSSSEELTGEISLSGQVSDDSKANSGVAEMYYAVPYKSITDPNQLADSSDSSKSIGERWTLITGDSSIVWSLTIKPEDIYSKDGSKITVKDGYIGYRKGVSGIYELPVWFKIVDNAGNIGYVTVNSVRYNPDADKPHASITYPVHNVEDPDNKESNDKNFGYVVMGGTIRFTGTAEDDEGIQAVYIQFDMDGDGKFENGEGIEGCPADVVAVEIPTSTENGNPEKGVLVKGTNSWSYSLKVSDLKNLLYSSENKKTLNVRSVALDTGSNDSPLLGEWSETIHISVNNDVPAFESVRLAQYSGSSESDVEIKTVEYQDDKYISGQNWYLVGTVSSNAGISNVLVEEESKKSEISIDTSTGMPQITDNNNLILEKKSDGGNIKELTYKIPIETSGRWEVKITVTDNASDGSQKTNYSNYSINIDNTPPAFYDTRNDSEKDTYGTIKLYKGEYGSSGKILDDKNFVQNSNKIFTLAGRVSEDGSGYENVIFYFKRVPKSVTSDNPIRVYNPMESHGLGNRNNRTDIEVDSATDGKVYINSDCLPVLYINSAVREDDNEYILASGYAVNNKNIRVGGLVKIGGLYRKITKVEYSSGTVTFDSSCAVSYKEAEFVYGMVVDNSGESLNYDNSIKNDDGDGMVESFSKSGSNYTWDASIDSTNIPDGPIEIHVVAFDKAGNSNHGYVKTSVSNNAPRIARVRLATDLNSNGKYEENEMEVFTYLEEDTKNWNETTKSSGTEIWNLDGKGWTIKKNLQVEPEFVGGTAPFHYIFTKESGIGDAKNLKSAKTGTETGSITENKQAFEILNDSFDESENFEDGINTYQFSFWDSTEETTPCQDSQWTVLNVQLKQDIADTVAPKVVIKPFYWNNDEDNSLYQNSLSNGHIELEEDWKNASGYNSSATSGEYDGDPKVSGKIVLHGTAYDDVCLSSLWIKFGKDKGTSTQKLEFENYLKTTGYGINGKYGDYVQVAHYNSSENKWEISAATMDSTGWEFTIEDGYFDQNGHKVNWTLSLDTAKLSGVAGSDIDFKIMAVDHLNNDAHKSSENNSTELNSDASINTADDVYNKPAYRMDVVPYITGLTTKLSSIEKKNPSVYGRTALGKYPVYYYTKNASGSEESEKIGVKGFNISNGANVYFEGNVTTTLDSDLKFELPANAKSGKIYVFVNSIENLNNKNYKDSKGSYKNINKTGSLYENYRHYYNRQANNVNNDNLEDDVEIAIWGINSQSAESPEGVITEPSMHINPVDGQLGFSFSSGNYGYYPDGVNNKGSAQTSSLKFWCRDYTPVNTMRFIYDNQGHMFGVHAGTDTNAPRNARFRLVSSVWGPSSTIDGGDTDWLCAYSANNALRLEYMGLNKSGNIVLNGTRFQFHPQLVAYASGNVTNLYMLYYDSLTNELRFRAGAMDNTKAFEFKGWWDENTNMSFGDFHDDAYTDGRNKSYQVTNYNHVSVLASSATTSYAPGMRYAIAVVPGSGSTPDTVVVVWHDPIHNTLWYSYLENPIVNNHKNVDSTTHVNKSWHTPTAILDGISGGYCAIAVDPDNHVHIAAYSKENTGSLVYTYLDTYKSDYIYEKNSVFVDSYGATGQYITIDFAKNGTGTDVRYVPYIGYLMTSLQYPKYAYLVDSESSGKNGGIWSPKPGTDEDYNMYTGAWESVILPTQNEFILDDICIGVLRNADGTLKNIPVVTGTDKCGGNGTSNPVLGYGINYSGRGYIETAQLK